MIRVKLTSFVRLGPCNSGTSGHFRRGCTCPPVRPAPFFEIAARCHDATTEHLNVT